MSGFGGWLVVGEAKASTRNQDAEAGRWAGGDVALLVGVKWVVVRVIMAVGVGLKNS